MSNIPPKIKEKVGRNLYLQKYHPLEIIKTHITKHFDSIGSFATYEGLNPYVSIVNNFDKLLIPTDHPARGRTDTYYLDDQTVLRTHTSAHQYELLKKGERRFLVTGDVYRKDEVNCTHSPVFHQMEGVSLVEKDQDPEEELKTVLVGLVQYLFPKCEYRINPDYFPFTHPSFEIEVKYSGKWLEILGCGVIQPAILNDAGLVGEKGWAFGLGLERLAMILFNIPDIRLFWTDEPKFLDQFKSGEIVTYQPYYILEPITKDLCFWVTPNKVQDNKWSHENDFYEICRDVTDDLLESIELYNVFLHPKHQKYAISFHFTYSPPDTKISNPGEFTKIVLDYQDKIAATAAQTLGIELRYV